MCVFASSQLQQQRRLFIPTLHILRGFPRGAITTTRKKKKAFPTLLFFLLFCIVVVTMRSHWIMKLLLASWVSLMKFYAKFNNHLSSLSAPFDINCYEILYNKNQKGTKPSWVGVHTSEFAIIHTNKDMNRQRTIKKKSFLRVKRKSKKIRKQKKKQSDFNDSTLYRRWIKEEPFPCVDVDRTREMCVGESFLCQYFVIYSQVFLSNVLHERNERKIDEEKENKLSKSPIGSRKTFLFVVFCEWNSCENIFLNESSDFFLARKKPFTDSPSRSCLLQTCIVTQVPSIWQSSCSESLTIKIFCDSA